MILKKNSLLEAGGHRFSSEIQRGIYPWGSEFFLNRIAKATLNVWYFCEPRQIMETLSKSGHVSNIKGLVARWSILHTTVWNNHFKRMCKQRQTSNGYLCWALLSRLTFVITMNFTRLLPYKSINGKKKLLFNLKHDVSVGYNKDTSLKTNSLFVKLRFTSAKPNKKKKTPKLQLEISSQTLLHSCRQLHTHCHLGEFGKRSVSLSLLQSSTLLACNHTIPRLSPRHQSTVVPGSVRAW